MKQNQTKVKREKILLKNKMGNEEVRSDIIFKAILRAMRRHYLNEFNSLTFYNSKKRYKKITFLADNLKFYLNQAIFPQIAASYRNKTFSEELIFILGSLFYPKTMKKIEEGGEQCRQIDLLKKGLNNFKGKYLGLIKQYPSYQFILCQFVKTQGDRFLAENQTMKVQREEYRKGFQYILAEFDGPIVDYWRND